MSAIASMRAATWPSHQKLEKALNMGEPLSSMDACREYLERMWGFCAGLEQKLEPELVIHALPDYASRRKLPLIYKRLPLRAIHIGASLLFLAPGALFIWRGFEMVA